MSRLVTSQRSKASFRALKTCSNSFLSSQNADIASTVFTTSDIRVFPHLARPTTTTQARPVSHTDTSSICDHVCHRPRRPFTTSTNLKMASDEDYMAFLNKANQDPSEGQAVKSSSSAKQTFKTTDSGAQVPAVLKTAVKDAFYTSDADEPFEPVCLNWDEGGKGLPDEGTFAVASSRQSSVAPTAFGLCNMDYKSLDHANVCLR